MKDGAGTFAKEIVINAIKCKEDNGQPCTCNALVKCTSAEDEDETVHIVKEIFGTNVMISNIEQLGKNDITREFGHITMWEGTTGGYKVSWLFKSGEELKEKFGDIYQQWYTDGNNFIVIIEDKRADYNEYSISNESVNHILDAEFLKKLK